MLAHFSKPMNMTICHDIWETQSKVSETLKIIYHIIFKNYVCICSGEYQDFKQGYRTIPE